ncbi:coagulation factor IX isoform X2 [Aphidius gifuensis]|uniref:coagulation factor IX isoform X2 n=1 Tax=Aphidius gifuensis TaxID=684658 RepID=UPI001CDC3A7A|nr:coagulation factor IX isoform X2 [Aphidius gifuensis]
MRALIKCHWYIMIILLCLDLINCLSLSSSSHPVNRTKINSRRKRYVRFPSASTGFIYDGLVQSQNSRSIYASPRFSPVWRQQKSFRWSPPGPPTGPSVPIMAHRTPRLIFRDDYPTLPASGPPSGPANLFFQSNQLSLDIDEDSREKSRKEKKPLWEGDDSLCGDGRSCEFFLKCWMSAGLLDGPCGGIMYACCARKDSKDLTDLNVIDTSKEQYNHLLDTDTFTDTPINEQCGISSTKQTAQRRIVGGDDAGFGSFPWQAYIRIGSSRCGGTLVNRFHVVTAGHCVAKASARQVQVTLGDYAVNSATENLPAYTFGVREIRVHPYFKFTPQADRFDVAVLKLDRPVHYMSHISPICLPDRNEDFLGQYGWAAGWGALQAGSRLRPKTLQSVDVPVIDNRVCERWHRSNGINVVIYDEMMCAGYRGGGKDSCQGDSGGPLMLEKTGRWYLIGIVSAGYSCAQPGQPGIYHRVAKTVDWITYVINS